MSGKKSRDKGCRTERSIVNTFKDAGIPAERVPLSGAVHGSFGGDIIIGDDKQKAEVKCRTNGFKKLYSWLEDNDYLIVKADRQEPLVVMEIGRFINLFKGVIGK